MRRQVRKVFELKIFVIFMNIALTFVTNLVQRASEIFMNRALKFVKKD